MSLIEASWNSRMKQSISRSVYFEADSVKDKYLEPDSSVSEQGSDSRMVFCICLYTACTQHS